MIDRCLCIIISITSRSEIFEIVLQMITLNAIAYLVATPLSRFIGWLVGFALTHLHSHLLPLKPSQSCLAVRFLRYEIEKGLRPVHWGLEIRQAVLYIYQKGMTKSF